MPTNETKTIAAVTAGKQMRFDIFSPILSAVLAGMRRHAESCDRRAVPPHAVKAGRNCSKLAAKSLEQFRIHRVSLE